MKESVASFITAFIREYEKENSRDIWRKPIVKFGDGTLREWKELRNIVHPEHYMPDEILADVKTVITYFIPYDECIGNSNISGELNSKDWAMAYERTEALVTELEKELIIFLEKKGYRAERIDEKQAFDKEMSRSRWSQRHVARYCGLGTFGINNMLITEMGCCGRIGSLVTNLDVLSDLPLEMEYCLKKRTGACGLCIDRCPSTALTDMGYDIMLCRQQCDKNRKVYNNINTCGKCVVGVPCTYRKP